MTCKIMYSLTTSELCGTLETRDYITFKFKCNDGTLLPINPKNKHRALLNDIVIWNTDTEELKLYGRREHFPLVGTLELASKTKYGITSRGAPMYLFVPMNNGYPPMVVGCSERNVSCNRLAVVEFDTWAENSNLPRGQLRRILGPCGDYEAESQAVLLTHNPFPPCKTIDIDISKSDEWETRAECPQPTWNIDPLGCVDVDDVLSYDLDSEGNRRLWITISDVSERVVSGSKVDDAAGNQSCTAYYHGVAMRPMLPAILSENYCSLLEGEWRPGVTLRLTCGPDGQIEKTEWLLTKCMVQKAYTYENIVSEGVEDGLAEPLDTLKKAAGLILGRPTDDPHEWIEAMMLFYNKAGAKVLASCNTGILRKHRGADKERYEKFMAIGGPELAVLANSAAEYCSAQDPERQHAGLGADVYTHLTSPIRRYADLDNQRLLKIFIRGNTPHPDEYPPDWMNRRQKDVKRYERDMFFLDKIQLGRISSIEVIVLEITERKVKCYVPEWKQLISWRPSVAQEITEGQRLELEYFVNAQQRRWKDRIVWRLKSGPA
jgi:exoribonuclease R